MPALEGLPSHGFYAVFDGHGGSYIAKQAAMQTVSFVVKTEDFQRDPHNPLSVGNALRKGFLALDDDMRLLPSVRSGEDHSGCTAIGIMVTPTHFVVGNCGECWAARGFSGCFPPAPPPPLSRTTLSLQSLLALREPAALGGLTPPPPPPSGPCSTLPPS